MKWWRSTRWRMALVFGVLALLIAVGFQSYISFLFERYAQTERSLHLQDMSRSVAATMAA